MRALLFDPAALGFLEKQQRGVRKRIFEKIAAAKENPYRHFKRLEWRKDCKLRVGDYRVIADIDAKHIHVTAIGHRKNIYDR